ncbi:MAG: hypothetical protein AAGA99_21180 [Actinomycetota bacterium]
MSRRYAKLQTTIWADEDFTALSGTARFLFVRLLSEPTLSHAGVCAVQERRWARSMGFDVAEVTIALDELTDGRFVLVDEDQGELLVRSWVRHAGMLDSPKTVAPVAKDIDLISSRALREAVLMEVARRAPEIASDAAREKLGELIPTRWDTPPDSPPDAPSNALPDSPPDGPGSGSGSGSGSSLPREQESSTSTRNGPGRAEPDRAVADAIAQRVLDARQTAGLHTSARRGTLAGIAHSLRCEAMPDHEIEQALATARVPTKAAVVSIVNAERAEAGADPFVAFDPERH